MSAIFYALVSVLLVSVVSLVGVATISIKEEKLKTLLIYMISFSAGALMGDVFIHILPEINNAGYTTYTAFYILFGIALSFVTEKVIHWRHCHLPTTKEHVHPFALMNLLGDSIHNFIDGLIIGASYLVNIPLGVATTVAVIFHEIPQEIGDFGVLLYGGFTKKRALFLNFVTALAAVLGAVVSLWLGSLYTNINNFLLPFAAGSFIYIAGSDLIPELHKETLAKKSMFQIMWFCLGIAVLASLLWLE